MVIPYEQLRSELIQELGLGQLSEEKQGELLDKMTEALMKKIIVDTMQRLGQDGASAYEKFLETNPDIAAIETYLSEKIPDYNEMTVKIVADFKKEMRGEI